MSGKLCAVELERRLEDCWKAEVGARLRQVRLALGLTQKQAATLIGTNQFQLSRWESGHVAPSLRSATDCAEAYRCSLDFIVGSGGAS